MLHCPNCGEELNPGDYMYRDTNRAVIGCENCIETVRAEIALAARRKVLENQVERLRTYLSDALGGEKFQTAKVSVTFRKTSRVELSEPALAIAWAQTHGYGGLVKYKAPEIGKDDLGKILKSGIEVPGAELVEGLSMGVK